VKVLILQLITGKAILKIQKTQYSIFKNSTSI